MRSGEQEKMIHYSCEDGIENPSLAITDCHHSASLMMQIGNPRDGFFYPIHKLMNDSYNPDSITWEISEEGFEQLASVIDFCILGGVIR